MYKLFLAALVPLMVAPVCNGQQIRLDYPAVVSLKGTLTARQPRADVRMLRLHDAVMPGDELATGENSEAVIRMSDGSTVRVFPDSRLIFNEQSADIREWLHLWLGSIKVHILKLTGRPNTQSMSTPSAVIAVRGTTFSVFVDEMTATLVAVDEGVVAVANSRWPDEEVLLAAGQRSWIRPGERPMQAQRFRGRSEFADLIPLRAGSGRSGMADSAMRSEMGNTSAGRPGHVSTGSMGGRMAQHQ